MRRICLRPQMRTSTSRIRFVVFKHIFISLCLFFLFKKMYIIDVNISGVCRLSTLIAIEESCWYFYCYIQADRRRDNGGLYL